MTMIIHRKEFFQIKEDFLTNVFPETVRWYPPYNPYYSRMYEHYVNFRLVVQDELWRHR